MIKTLTILLYFCPILVFGQQFAEFSTDTTRFRRYYREGIHNLPVHISDQEWIINGQRMTYGSKKIRVKVNPSKLDTILYKGFKRSEFDTIICNISKPRKYKFFYNDCCGAFNVQDVELNEFIQGKIIYRLKTNDKPHKYLGTIGEVGIIVKEYNNDTLKDNCRSAMSPNVYKILFRQIKSCKDSTNCNESICLQVKNTDEPIWGYSYKTISIKMDLLFLPLSEEPLIVIYDPKTDKVNIE